MTAVEEIKLYEKKLESVIKQSFQKIIINEKQFPIAADYDTHLRIDEIINGIGLQVYGMSVSPSEFIIKFEFCGPYLDMTCSHKPNYCSIALKNDGEYAFNLFEDSLEEDWYLSITDNQFNKQLLSEGILLETIEEMNKVLFISILSI